MRRILACTLAGFSILLISSGQTFAQNGQGANALPNPPPPPRPLQQPTANYYPILLKTVRPTYPASAIPDRIRGTVELSVEVGLDGTVGEVTVTRSLGAAFDEEAIKAAKQWLFRPALQNGKAVPMRLMLAIEFRPDLGASCFLTARTENEAGLVKPVLKRRVEPTYTAQALRAKIQGDVVVEAVVEPDGVVSCARVAKSLDNQFGLDDEALRAASRWMFEPGRLNGQPVPVLMTLTLTYRLH